jgi:hypothetical protein
MCCNDIPDVHSAALHASLVLVFIYCTYELLFRNQTSHYLPVPASLVKVQVTLRLTVGQSVSKSWCRAPLMTRYLFVFVGAPSLTRGRVCFVYAAGPRQRSLPRVRVPWDWRPYFTLQIWDFPFRRLLRLAGSRWRYSTPPPHGRAEQ